MPRPSSRLGHVGRISMSSTRTPDFRARVRAKQAWLVRRSEPGRRLLLGLIGGGGAIGCLSAFVIMSVVPSEIPAANSTVSTASNLRPVSETTGGPQGIGEVAADHLSKAAIHAAGPASAPSSRPAPVVSERMDSEMSPEPPTAPATPSDLSTPQNLAAAVAQGRTTEPKAKKKNRIQHSAQPTWAFERRSRPSNQWASQRKFFHW